MPGYVRWCGPLGLGLALLGCADARPIFVDLDDLPDEVRWFSLLPLGPGRVLRPGTGLLSREGARHSASLDLGDFSELVVVGYPDAFLQPLPSSEVLANSSVRWANSDAIELPRPSFSVLGGIEDGVYTPTLEVDPGPLTTDWLECPPNLGDGGFALLSCLNCVGTVARRGCRLEADMTPCAMQGFEVSLGATGASSSLFSSEPRLGSCALTDPETSLARLDCEFPERAGGCSIAVIPQPYGEDFEVLKLLDVPPVAQPFGGALMPGGHLFGAALVGSEIVVATAGTSTGSTMPCAAGTVRPPSRVVYVDRASFQITRTATAPGCLRLPLLDPTEASGFLATFADAGSLRFGRFDDRTELLHSVAISRLSESYVTAALLLAPERVVLVLNSRDEVQPGRVVFVRVRADGLSIEHERSTSAVSVAGASRVSDTAVAVLADSYDNFRIIDLEGERKQRFLSEDCGFANLSAAGFWMAEDESLAVSAQNENGVLLLVNPNTGHCRVARAPVHPETIDPIALSRIGDDLIASFWGRSQPRKSWIGRLSLRRGHLEPAFTPIGPGLVSAFVVDGEVAYGMITDRAELVRIRGRP